MARFKVMGSKGTLDQVFAKWPDVAVRGGHTVIEDRPVKTQKEIFDNLVTVQRFTAIDTSTPEAPVIVKKFDPGIQELTFIPQFAGG